ncbi:MULTISPECIES: hypothetical protein [Laceyella]|jgi:hypothetical protein|uniref:Uncharacterized protein n=1 Tax=Laceyella sediminis TaxID=573074 RepID=A0ABX5EQG3_9BACL|nr:hypothetical protein [Laceyella sediminis]MRG29342.1 hypothetical protein [Laceyella tengchongensis]PRZ13276.1 hypothetical protein CLV36_10985 [Laceyella sediminis]
MLKFIKMGDYRINVEENLGRIYGLKKIKEEKTQQGIKVTYGLIDGYAIYQFAYDANEQLVNVEYLEDEVARRSFKLREEYVEAFAYLGREKQEVENSFGKYAYRLIKEIKKDNGETIGFYGNLKRQSVGIVVIYDKNNKVKEAMAIPRVNIDEIDVDRYL